MAVCQLNLAINHRADGSCRKNTKGQSGLTVKHHWAVGSRCKLPRDGWISPQIPRPVKSRRKNTNGWSDSPQTTKNRKNTRYMILILILFCFVFFFFFLRGRDKRNSTKTLWIKHWRKPIATMIKYKNLYIKYIKSIIIKIYYKTKEGEREEREQKYLRNYIVLRLLN
jgi:hypothetical protein